MEYKDILGRDLQVGDYVLLATGTGHFRRAVITELLSEKVWMGHNKTEDIPTIRVKTIIVSIYPNWDDNGAERVDITHGTKKIRKPHIGNIVVYRVGEIENAFTPEELKHLTKKA